MAAEPDCTIAIVDGDEGEGEGEGEEGEGEGEGCFSDADCGPGQACVFSGTGGAQEEQEDRAAPCEPDANGECNGDPINTVGICVDIGGGCANVLCAPGFMCIEDDAGNAQCIFVDDGLCFTDSDCLQGERCNTDSCFNGGQERPDCDPATNECSDDLIACQGICESTGDGTCASDFDCGEGFHCEFGGGVEPQPGCDDATGENCEFECDPATGNCDSDQPEPAPLPEGRCVENEHTDTCSSDADCGDGFHCEVGGTDPGQGGGEAPDFCDPNSPDCGGDPMPPPPDGVCVPNETDECAALCGPGAQCVIFDDGSVSCEPIDPPTAECVSDEQCPDGTTCNAADVCLSNPECDANGACTDECWGFCVRPEPQGCIADSDCAEGQVCSFECNNPDGTICLVAQGQCVDADPNAP